MQGIELSCVFRQRAVRIDGEPVGFEEQLCQRAVFPLSFDRLKWEETLRNATRRRIRCDLRTMVNQTHDSLCWRSSSSCAQRASPNCVSSAGPVPYGANSKFSHILQRARFGPPARTAAPGTIFLTGSPTPSLRTLS